MNEWPRNLWVKMYNDNLDDKFSKIANWVSCIVIGIWVVLLLLLLSACATTTGVTRAGIHKGRGYARVTFYNPFEKDKVKVKVKRGHHYRYVKRWVRWGTRTASGVRAIKNFTIAAPSRYPFGTKIRIPELKPVLGQDTFVVQDRGAGDRILHEREWLDVYCENKRIMNWLAHVMQPYLEFQVVP